MPPPSETKMGRNIRSVENKLVRVIEHRWVSVCCGVRHRDGLPGRNYPVVKTYFAAGSPTEPSIGDIESDELLNRSGDQGGISPEVCLQLFILREVVAHGSEDEGRGHYANDEGLAKGSAVERLDLSSLLLLLVVGVVGIDIHQQFIIQRLPRRIRLTQKRGCRILLRIQRRLSSIGEQLPCDIVQLRRLRGRLLRILQSPCVNPRRSRPSQGRGRLIGKVQPCRLDPGSVDSAELAADIARAPGD